MSVTRWFTFSAVARVVAAGFLFNTLKQHPSDYFILLRGVVCAAALCSASVASGFRQAGWLWSLAIVGLLYNPLLPAPFTVETQHAVDFAVGIFLLATIPFVRESLHDTAGPHPAYLLLIGCSVLSCICVWQNIQLTREVRGMQADIAALHKPSPPITNARVSSPSPAHGFHLHTVMTARTAP